MTWNGLVPAFRSAANRRDAPSGRREKAWTRKHRFLTSRYPNSMWKRSCSLVHLVPLVGVRSRRLWRCRSGDGNRGEHAPPQRRSAPRPWPPPLDASVLHVAWCHPLILKPRWSNLDPSPGWRLLDDGRPSGVWPDSVQVLGWTSPCGCPLGSGVGSPAVCVPVGHRAGMWLKRVGVAINSHPHPADRRSGLVFERRRHRRHAPRCCVEVSECDQSVSRSWPGAPATRALVIHQWCATSTTRRLRLADGS